MLAGMLALTAVARADDTAATAVVNRLNDALLDAMKEGEALGYQGRFDRLAAGDAPGLRPRLHGREIARQRVEVAQRGRPGALARRCSREFTIANYAANFDRFTGQRFDVLGEEASVNDTKLVKTKVVIAGRRTTSSSPTACRKRTAPGASSTSI